MAELRHPSFAYPGSSTYNYVLGPPGKLLRFDSLEKMSPVLHRDLSGPDTDPMWDT